MRKWKPAIAVDQACDDFNARVAIGDSVSVRLDDGTAKITTTVTKAQLLSGHTPVIWLDGIRGCYALDRVSPIVKD